MNPQGSVLKPHPHNETCWLSATVVTQGKFKFQEDELTAPFSLSLSVCLLIQLDIEFHFYKRCWCGPDIICHILHINLSYGGVFSLFTPFPNIFTTLIMVVKKETLI